MRQFATRTLVGKTDLIRRRGATEIQSSIAARESRRNFLEKASMSALTLAATLLIPDSQFLLGQNSKSSPEIYPKATCKTSPELSSDIFPQVKDVLVKQLGVNASKVSPSTTLIADLGFDSYKELEMFAALEETFNMTIPDNQCSKVVTVGDAADTIATIKSDECEGRAPKGGTSTAHLYRQVKDIVIEQLGVKPSEVKPSALFVDDLGADSLDTVELVMAFEETFEVEIHDEQCEKALSVWDIVKLIKDLRSGQKH